MKEMKKKNKLNQQSEKKKKISEDESTENSIGLA